MKKKTSYWTRLLFSFNLLLLVVICNIDGTESLKIREHSYEKVLVQNIMKQLELEDKVTDITNGNKQLNILNHLSNKDRAYSN